MLTQEPIDSFYEFASSQLASGGADLSLDEVYSVWRAKNPLPAELAESLAALRSAYSDLKAGDAGRPARDALREACERLGLVIEE